MQKTIVKEEQKDIRHRKQKVKTADVTPSISITLYVNGINNPKDRECQVKKKSYLTIRYLQ